MREYEAMIISKIDLPEADMTKMVERWESIIGKDGGQIVKKEPWGVKRFAYPIEKQTRGNYFVYDIATTQENIRELERVLKYDENVVRSIIIKLADDVNVAERRIELQKKAEEAVRREAEMAREKTEQDVIQARRGREDQDEEAN